MSDLQRLANLLRAIQPNAVLVVDSSVVLANPGLTAWDLGYTTVIVISNLVLGELERRKSSRHADSESSVAANTVMRSIAEASTAQGAELATGLRINPNTWLISVPINRTKLARGLDAKQNDQQIAGVAGIIADITNLPIVLLTGDINQKVFASSVGIPAHLERQPFAEPGSTALHELIERLRASNYRLTPTEPLDNNLPARESIVTNFVGRRHHLMELERWMIDPDARKWALTGDGGKGKTAIAYTFAESVVAAAPINIVTNVIWMSAKRRRYVDGTILPIGQPDFATLEQALDFLLGYFNEVNVLSADLRTKRSRVREWLTEFPSLVIVDDLDSIETSEEDVAEFFLDDILKTRSKVLLTSRRHYPGMGRRETEVRGLEGEEAHTFIRTKVREFGLQFERFETSFDRILRATEGSPLYIEDLLRLCHVTGVGDAIHQWERRRGDAARRYALEREVEELTRSSPVDREVLIACALAGGPVTTNQLCLLCKRERDDVESALEHLRQFYLMPAPSIVEDVVWFDLNPNTRAQILTQFGNSDDARRIRGTLITLGNQPAERRVHERIVAAARESRLLAWRQRWSDAERLLRDAEARFGEHHQLLQALGWLYSRWEPKPRVTEAREAFQRAHQLGTTIARLYWDWAVMEQREGEFRRAIQVAEIGLLRFEQSLDLRLRQVEAMELLADQLDRRMDRDQAVSVRRNIVAVVRDAAVLPAGNASRRAQKSQLFDIGLRAARQLGDVRREQELHEARRLALGDSSAQVASVNLTDTRLRSALADVAPLLDVTSRESYMQKALEVVRALQASADFFDSLKNRGLPLATIAVAIGYVIPGFDSQRLGYTNIVSFLQVALRESSFRLARPSVSLMAEPRLIMRESSPEGLVPLPDISEEDLQAESELTLAQAGARALRLVEQMSRESRFSDVMGREGLKLMDYGHALRREMPSFVPRRFGFRNLTSFLQHVLTGSEYCIAEDPQAPGPTRPRICVRTAVPVGFVVLPDL